MATWGWIGLHNSFVALMLAALVFCQQNPATPDQICLGYGREAIEMIHKNFYLPEQKLYAEQIALGGKPSQVSFNWGVGVMLSALNAAARVDKKYLPWLVEFADASRVYWNDQGPVPGYDVLPMPKPIDRYYDDNAWMAMALDETYQVTGDKKYLDWAKGALEFVLSGEDRQNNAGVYWREKDRSGYATCSCGPAAAACMALYKETRDPLTLQTAMRIYAWTKAHLQDPKDHLFWDSVSPQGMVTDTKWSYNTALMIRAAAELYAATRKPKYKADMVQMQSASAKKWLGSNLRDEGRFAHLLMDSWIYQRRLVPMKTTGQAASDYRSILTPLAWLHGLARSDDGFYGKRWDQMPNPNQKTFALIDQASAARAFFEATQYFRDRGF